MAWRRSYSSIFLNDPASNWKEANLRFPVIQKAADQPRMEFASVTAPSPSPNTATGLFRAWSQHIKVDTEVVVHLSHGTVYTRPALARRTRLMSGRSRRAGRARRNDRRAMGLDAAALTKSPRYSRRFS